jgi:hypothetical protein
MSEFMDYGDPAAMRAYIPKLEAEVERLRGLFDQADLARAQLERKNERLRAGLERIAGGSAQGPPYPEAAIIARNALAEEKPGAHHDAGPGLEWERGPNMKDVG